MSTVSLLDQMAAETAGAAGSRPFQQEPQDDVVVPFPKLGSADEYIETFNRIIRTSSSFRPTPVLLSPTELASVRKSGWKMPPSGSWCDHDPRRKGNANHCHRYRWEVRPLVAVESIVGKVALVKLENDLYASLSGSTGGSFLNMLQTNIATRNGQWRPAEVEVSITTGYFDDGLVRSNERMAPGMEWEIEGTVSADGGTQPIGGDPTKPMKRAKVPVKCIAIVIRWVDMLNAREPRVTDKGEIIPDLNVQIGDEEGGDKNAAILSKLTDVVSNLAARDARPAEAPKADPAPMTEREALIAAGPRKPGK
jgi:hypothetical protein